MDEQQCIFCHISAGRVAGKKVYEDDLVVAVLDINPANPGHVLLVPRKHVMILPQVEDDVLAHMGMVAKALSMVMLKSLKAQGVSVFIANGVVAGQRAPHFLMHIIPRVENDGVGLVLPELQIVKDEYQKLHGVMKSVMDKVFGLAEGAPVSAYPKQAKQETNSDLDELSRLLLGK